MVVAVLGLMIGPPLVALGSALTASPVAVVGAFVALAGAVGLMGYGIEIWSRRGRWANDLAWHELAARHGLAGMAWFVVTVATLLVGLVRDGVAIPGWGVGAAAVPLIAGWAIQELVGAWGHLLPAVGPGSMAVKARQRFLLSRFSTARVVGWNVGLLLLWPGLGFGVPWLILGGLLLFAPAALAALALLALALLAAWRPAAAVTE
jgi:hypothetical protein